MENKFNAVIDVKKRSHRSWINFHNAALKEVGRPYYFGTIDVERCSTSYLNKAISESGLSAMDILHEIENRNLI